MSNSTITILGNNLDLLLNNSKPTTYEGGLFLPTNSDPGTGNIVIKGSPGTGKSTLALQLLHRITYNSKETDGSGKALNKDYYTIYFSIEEQIDHIINKMKKFNWKANLRKLIYLDNNDDFNSPESLANGIKEIMKSSKERIFLPMLSPRSIDGINKNTYWERYKQIEKFLIAADYIKNHFTDVPELKSICIDSLNVFGDEILSRDEIFRLFDLFKRYHIIGLFICEGNNNSLRQNVAQMYEDIDFSSEVVISLQNGVDKGYMMHYLEIEKSRYFPQVFGKHPYFIKHNYDGGKPNEEPYFPFWAYPSLHFKLNEFSNIKATNDTSVESLFNNWRNQYKNIIPDSFTRPFTITLSGPRNTFKSTIARDFLLQGLSEEKTVCDGLIISIIDKDDEEPDNWLRFKDNTLQNNLGYPYYTKIEGLNDLYSDGLNDKVLCIEKWVYKGSSKFVLKIIIKKKSITAEEFIHYIQYNILEKLPSIKRIVLDEVNLISISYPFLKSSITSGELFLNTFIELTKSKNIDLLITGTTGELSIADETVNRAISLSDLTITTKFCDIFGKQNVIISGGKLSSDDKNMDVAKLPGVLKLYGDNNEFFTINSDYLNGLVGFENGKIFRPGLTINLFEEGKLQKKYNKQITTMYNLLLPEHTVNVKKDNSDKRIFISTFNDRNVDAMKETIDGTNMDKPLEGTVVSMIDEYWNNSKNISISRINNQTNKDTSQIYYTNCLLLAYDKEIIEFDKQNYTWEGLYNKFSASTNELNKCMLDSDFFINETLSCLMLDTIFAVSKKDTNSLADVFESFKEADISKNDPFINELYYLNKMFNTISEEALKEKYKPHKKWQKMSHNSMMYICWYTQLREFLNFNHEFVSKIDVVGLPGSSFRGDWKLKVMEGSLSKEHGSNTITLLCRKEEQIKRFMQGIGLPAWLSPDSPDYKEPINDGNNSNILMGEFPAWIGSPWVTLNSIFNIYIKANRRSDIANYENIRHLLSASFRRLMLKNLSSENVDSYKDTAVKILTELQSNIKKI